MATTLDNLTLQLKENNEENVIGHERTRASLDSNFDNFFKFMNQSKLDNLEKQREAKNIARPLGAAGKGAQSDSGRLGILPVLGSLTGLLASITAFGAALAGLRGWEIDAIKNIKGSLLRFVDDFKLGSTKMIDDLKTNISKSFSNVLGNIRGNIVRYIDLILENLGIAKFEQLRDKAGRFTGERLTPLNKIGKFFDNVIEALKPVSKIAATLGKIAIFPLVTLLGDIGKIFGSISGFVGGKTMSLVGDLAGKFGKFAGLAGKILKPIGFIFSFVEGMNEAFKTEGTLLEKLSAGVSRFLADFFGAPLDLLKDLGAWILKKMGFDKEAKALKDFSIEELLFDSLQGIFDFVGKMFSDPVGTGKEILGGMIGWIKGLFFGVIKSIASSFGITLRSEEEKQLDATSALVSRLEKRIETMSSSSVMDVSKLRDSHSKAVAKVQRLKNENANPMHIKNAEHSVKVSKNNLDNALQRKNDQSIAIATARNDLSAAQAVQARLQNVVGQIGNNTTISSSSQPIVISQGSALNPADMLAQ